MLCIALNYRPQTYTHWYDRMMRRCEPSLDRKHNLLALPLQPLQ